MADEFFLTFEKIGSNSHTVTEPPAVASPPTDIDMAPKYGIRTFDQINASFSKLTGVPLTTLAVANTFVNVKQQMPSVRIDRLVPGFAPDGYRAARDRLLQRHGVHAVVSRRLLRRGSARSESVRSIFNGALAERGAHRRDHEDLRQLRRQRADAGVPARSVR